MDTGFKYKNQEPIYCNDMVRLKDNSIGFIFYDERVKAWAVKLYNEETNQASVSSLKVVFDFIKDLIV